VTVETRIEFAREVLWRHASVLLRRPPVVLATGLCAFEIAFYFAYAYGMGFTSARASPFWLPDSILLCATPTVLRSPRRYWWIFLLAPLPVRLFTSLPPEHPLWFLLGTYLVDSAKGLFAAVVLCRVLRDPGRLSSFRDLGWFALVAVLIVPAAGALASAGLWHALGANFWPTWSQWFMGDALAHIVVTPAILTVIFYSVPPIERRPGFARALEIAVILGGLAGASYLGFHVAGSRLPSFGPLFYAPIPFLYWAAFPDCRSFFCGIDIRIVLRQRRCRRCRPVRQLSAGADDIVPAEFSRLPFAARLPDRDARRAAKKYRALIG
jgi:integral membrane sensor domain MASE1